jgi:Zn-finger nucleic acid-binding protein
MALKCPRCRVDVRRKEVSEIAVDLCLRCEGVWFAEGDLRRIVDADPDIPRSALALAWSGSAPKGEKPGHTELTCPACDLTLDRVAFGDSGVLVDVCAKKCGLWLDDGELRKVFDWLSTEAGGAKPKWRKALDRVLKVLAR